MKKTVDILFLITGNPLPAMLDMAFVAQNSGKKVAMVLLQRGELDLRIDRSLVNYEILTINVPYKATGIKRFTSMPWIYQKVKKLVKNRLRPGGVLFSGSYDLLLFGYFISGKDKYRIRHQVRDLHSLQLSKSFRSKVFVFIESILLRKVEAIIVSSPEFNNKYYKKIYNGNVVLLENTPLKTTWEGFNNTKKDSLFKIGYIGIIRYKKSLYQLVDAVERSSEEGMDVKVLIAGGGETGDLKRRISKLSLFEFQGAFEYSKDIKQLYSGLDLIYAVYDSQDRNCQLAMPNKFYESIISKIPIIVASGTFVGEEVERLGIGASVDSGDVNSLERLLAELKHPDSWYERSLRNLNAIDTEAYYLTYHEQIKKSVSI